MDRNNIIGLVLIALILLAYSIYNVNTAPPAKPKQGEEQPLASDTVYGNPADTTFANGDLTADSTLPAGNDSLTAATDSINNANKLVEKYGAFAPSVTGEEDSFVLENNELRIVVSSLGGNIESIELKNFKTYDKQRLFLSKPGDQKFSIDLTPTLTSANLYFTSAGVENTAEGQKLTLTASTNNGGSLQQVYTLPSEGYLLDYNVVLNGLDKALPKFTYLMANWSRKVPQAEKKKDLENGKTKIYYNDDVDGVENLSESKDDEVAADGETKWVSYSQAFFNTTLIAGKDITFGDLKPVSKLSTKAHYLKEFSTEMQLPVANSSDQTIAMQYYLGPNDYRILKKMDIELEEIINLGSGIFAWVSIFNKWIIIPIFNFLNGFISNYGFIILILTLIIKVVLFPLTYKSYLSQAKMKVLKPELDVLKEKYKDDQAKFSQEQMKLWSKAGVNPLGGCLPTLLQMPILVAMYSFFPSSIELRQESFLWADDLSTYDTIYDFGFNIPLYGDHISLFTLLMAVTSIIYAVSNARMTGTAEGPMKYMPYVFPIMLLGIFNNFPAALTYYYFLANVISYLQQWAIRKFFIDDAKLHAQMQQKKAKPENPNSFGNRFRKAMEQAQNAQAEQQRKGNKKK